MVACVALTAWCTPVVRWLCVFFLPSGPTETNLRLAFLEYVGCSPNRVWEICHGYDATQYADASEALQKSKEHLVVTLLFSCIF